MIDFESLLLLLSCKNKLVVNGLVKETFNLRKEKEIPSQLVTDTAEALNTSEDKANLLLVSLQELVKTCVYNNCTGPQISEIFPENFHKNLKSLISQIIENNLPNWRKEIIQGNQQQFLPKLEDVKWRVDIKSGSNYISHMAVPTVLVEVKVKNVPKNVNSLDESSRIVSFELDSGTLQTMLDGLGKIRDQLQMVAGK